nr:sugar ABC transporter permease [Bacilli bacterium]
MKNIRIILIKIATQIFLLLLALITLLPFVYIILISFCKNVISAGAKIPKEFTFDNYKELFGRLNFLSYYKN